MSLVIMSTLTLVLCLFSESADASVAITNEPPVPIVTIPTPGLAPVQGSSPPTTEAMTTTTANSATTSQLMHKRRHEKQHLTKKQKHSVDEDQDQEQLLQTNHLEVNSIPSKVANDESEHTTALSILDSLLRKYDRRATPTNHKGLATIVNCKLYVRSLGSINPDTMDYQVDLYLRQHWSDQRLNHEKLLEPLDLNDPNLVKAIWKPEVYFPNAKDAEFQYVTVPNVLVRINPGGQILYMLRLKLKFSCMMELSKFPLDEQVCTMEIASFSKTTKELILQWKDHGIDISNEVKMPQFEIFKVIPALCQESFHIGNYSCLLAELHLKRSLGFHMVQSYLPTILIVVISWVSFWMDVDSVAGRTTLGVTTLLTVSSKASDVQAEVPLVSYVKAIDIWMGACTAFIFAALLEFTLTNYLWRKGRKGNSISSRRMISVQEKLASVAPAPADLNSRRSDNIQKSPVSPVSNSENGGHKIAFEMQTMNNATCFGHHQADFPEKRLFDKDFNTANSIFVDTQVVSKEDDDGARVQVRSPDVFPQSTDEDGKRQFFQQPGLQHPDFRRFSSYGGELSDCILAIQIDEWSRIFFPLTFAIFNVCYWGYYTEWWE